MRTVDKNLIIAGIPISLSASLRQPYELLVARLNTALSEFVGSDPKPKPVIRLHMQTSQRGFLEFNGPMWGSGGAENEDYSAFASKVSTAFGAFEAVTDGFHPSIHVSIQKSTGVDSTRKTSVPLRSVDQGVASSADTSGVYRLQLPLWSFEDVILSAETYRAIQRALAIIKSSDLVYEKWGMKSVDPFPKCAMSFHGPSGTGKTMAAHAVANQVGCQILAINVAEIESRFVGQSPRNVTGVFRMAEAVGAVLFFDEADWILGKRILDVTQGSDQAVNSLRSQMLMSLDTFKGIVIFATNQVVSYDFAFRSRTHPVQFDLPGEEERTRIWQKHLAPGLPVKLERGIGKLVQDSAGFSGRAIKDTIMLAIGEVLINGKAYMDEGDLFAAIQALRHMQG